MIPAKSPGQGADTIVFDEDNLVATKDHQVEFIKAADQEYGFDGLEYMEWADNYLSMQKHPYFPQKILCINAKKPKN